MNTVLASQEDVFGIVVYTGYETRARLNSRRPLSKFGRFDKLVNNVSKWLFLLMILLAVAVQSAAGWDFKYGRPLKTFCTILLLLSFLIPIALRTMLDMLKAFTAVAMPRDKKMGRVVVNNSSIPEELGSLEFLFTDKTGTLT